MNGNKSNIPATPAEAEELLRDLTEASERQMHRSIAQLQQRTITDLHESLRDACAMAYFRCLEVGLNPGEAHAMALSMRSEQYRIAMLTLREQIKAFQREHYYRIDAVRRWLEDCALLIQQTRAAEAAREGRTDAE